MSTNKVLRNRNAWLVVWNMIFMTFHILAIIIPTDFHIFRRVETTNQMPSSCPAGFLHHSQAKVFSILFSDKLEYTGGCDFNDEQMDPTEPLFGTIGSSLINGGF